MLDIKCLTLVSNKNIVFKKILWGKYLKNIFFINKNMFFIFFSSSFNEIVLEEDD